MGDSEASSALVSHIPLGLWEEYANLPLEEDEKVVDGEAEVARVKEKKEPMAKEEEA